MTTVGYLKIIIFSGDAHCPVASFEKYISKLCPERNDLWQRPKESFDKSDTAWYCNAPLGKTSLLP